MAGQFHPQQDKKQRESELLWAQSKFRGKIPNGCLSATGLGSSREPKLQTQGSTSSIFSHGHRQG